MVAERFYVCLDLSKEAAVEKLEGLADGAFVVHQAAEPYLFFGELTMVASGALFTKSIVSHQHGLEGGMIECVILIYLMARRRI